MRRIPKVYEDCSVISFSIQSTWKSNKEKQGKVSVGVQTKEELYSNQEREIQAAGLYSKVIHAQVAEQDQGSNICDYLVSRFDQNKSGSKKNHRVKTNEEWKSLVEEGMVTVDLEVVTDTTLKLEVEQYVEYVDAKCNVEVQTNLHHDEELTAINNDWKTRVLQSPKFLSFLNQVTPLVIENIEKNNKRPWSSSKSLKIQTQEENIKELFFQANIWKLLTVDLEKKRIVYPDWSSAQRLHGVIVNCTLTRNKERVYDIEYEDGTKTLNVREEYIRLLLSSHEESNTRKKATTSNVSNSQINRFQEGVRVHAKVKFKNGITKYLPGRIVKVTQQRSSSSGVSLSYDVECEGSRLESGLSIDDLIIGLQEGQAVEAKRPRTITLQCTKVCWNSTGNIIAGSFGRSDVSGWCDSPGAICCWNVNQTSMNSSIQNGNTHWTENPDFVLDHPSGILTLAFHPSIPSLIAAGTYNGEVLFWDLTKPELAMVTPIMEYSHRDPVLDLLWVPSKNASVSSSDVNNWLVCSISGDGKILFWSRGNKLQFPVKGYTVTKGKISSSRRQYPQCHGVTALATSSTGTSGNSSLSNASATLSKWLLCGQEDGGIVRCPLPRMMNYEITFDMFKSFPAVDQVFPPLSKRNEVFTYRGHVGPVTSLDYSPFHRNLFLSGGTDGVVQLYFVLEKQPLLRWEPAAIVYDQRRVISGGNSSSSNPSNRYSGMQSSSGTSTVLPTSIVSVKFSQARASVFAAGSNDGMVYVFDLSKSVSQPVLVLSILNTVASMNSNSGRQKYNSNVAIAGAKSASVMAISFNPMRKNILACSDSNGKVHLWRIDQDLSRPLSADQAQDLESIIKLKYTTSNEQETVSEEQGKNQDENATNAVKVDEEKSEKRSSSRGRRSE